MLNLKFSNAFENVEQLLSTANSQLSEHKFWELANS